MIKYSVLEVVMFVIYIPKICGTCSGAQKALDIVYELYEREKTKKHPKKIVVYKEILHNKKIIEDLKNKNIECIDSLQNIDENTIVVIRAHGEGESTYKYLEDKNIEYYDATCKNVLRIHDIISKKYYQNYEIIIIGKKVGENEYHPEVSGSNGWCQNNAIIIDSINDVEKLEITNDNILIICQTTFGEREAIEISEKIKEKYKNKNVEFVNSICNAQKMIQKHSIEVAKKCDYMIIIGGKNSSNTNELYKLCNDVCESVKVSDISELLVWLKTAKISSDTNIGISGGASTPKSEIEKYKQLIEFYLFYKNEKRIFEKEIINYNKNFIDKNDNKFVHDAIKKFIDVNQGGKYLRATLISLGYKLFSKEDCKDYVPLALAYETFQTSILIHDDIIDNAEKRRGKDTVPTAYRKEFINKNNNIGNNIANSLGICIGDLGFYFANNILLKTYNKNVNIYKVLQYYNDIVIKTIKGEIIDVKLPYDIQYENLSKLNENDVLEIYRLKTAWYTVIGPFCLGCLLAGAEMSDIKKFEPILENIGIAFQIKDDIIGVFGDENYIGKSTNSDISEFKQTILYSYVHNNKEYLNKLNKYYGKQDITNEETDIVKQIFIDSGALDYANKVMNKLFEESIEQIKKLSLTEKYEDILLGFVNYLVIRQK